MTQRFDACAERHLPCVERKLLDGEHAGRACVDGRHERFVAELTGSLGQLVRGFAGEGTSPLVEPTAESGTVPEPTRGERRRRVYAGGDLLTASLLLDPAEALAQAQRELKAATDDATSAGTLSGRPFDRSVEAGQGPSHAAAPAVEPTTPVEPSAPEDDAPAQ